MQAYKTNKQTKTKPKKRCGPIYRLSSPTAAASDMAGKGLSFVSQSLYTAAET